MPKRKLVHHHNAKLFLIETGKMLIHQKFDLKVDHRQVKRRDARKGKILIRIIK